MRIFMYILVIVVFVLCSVSVASARDVRDEGLRFQRMETNDRDPSPIDPGLQTLMTSAAVDTYCIVWYNFEQMDWQGWTSIDNTAQVDTFFHVDDFSGLSGGDFSRLFALEGSKSLWCGARPGSDHYICSWSSAPGYGNDWKQIVHSDVIPFTGVLTWSFKCVVDSEPDWDFTYIEYDAGDNNWVEIASYDGIDTLTVVEQLLLSQAATKLRFRFVSDEWMSDQDGTHNTDGGFIVDSITVTDAGGVIDFEDFESYETGTKGDLGFWHCTIADGYGAYAGLRTGLIAKDPCGDNFGTQIIFFNGSPYPSADYPGLFDTPFCTGPGGISAPCQNEQVISPIINMMAYSSSCDENQDTAIPAGDATQLGGTLLRFTTYRDLPVSNLVFYTWSVRSIDEFGCPGQWMDRNFVYYGGDKDYISSKHQDISDLVGNDPIQVKVGVRDMCSDWYGVVGDCAAHTPSPWLDNVRVYRYKTIGPSWSVRRLDLFQDTFPQDNELSSNPMEEFCRADMAAERAPAEEYTRIDPGDSAVVTCAAPIAGGLDTLATGEARVYCHVNLYFIGPTGEKPDITGAQLEGTYGTWISTDGNGWDIFLCEPAAFAPGLFAPEQYCIDLNDSLFTRGYMVEYYFKAWDLLGNESTLPASAEKADGNRYEFTCLPTLRQVPGVLYVDDFDGRGTFIGQVQQYFDPAFEAVTPSGEPLPDRYDVNAPSSAVDNGIGAYVSVEDASSIFCQAYHTVIHDSGDLNAVTISVGTENSDKSNDAQIYVDWMNISEHKVGLLVMGEGIATELSQSSATVALELVSTICGVTLVENSYYNMTGGREAGGVVNPLITGVSGGPYSGLSYYAFGGCPIVNYFDVLATNSNGVVALQYPDYNSLSYIAGIYTDQLNSASQPLRTIWVGHSFMLIRDAVEGTLARNVFLAKTYEFFELGLGSSITDSNLPKAYSLEQNFPNPFNPSTRISLTLPVKGHVNLKIYNVAGQLVRTLQDGVMDAGSHELTWDGSNNLGTSVASGVYFYKLNASDNYENVRKMVLLR